MPTSSIAHKRWLTRRGSASAFLSGVSTSSRSALVDIQRGDAPDPYGWTELLD